MIARSAAAATITHFAQASGPQTRASTTMPTASKKRQKHNFIIPISFSKRFSYHMKKDIKVQAQKSISEKNQNSVQGFLLLCSPNEKFLLKNAL
jgi:Tfp pilus assembly protein PilE